MKPETLTLSLHYKVDNVYLTNLNTTGKKKILTSALKLYKKATALKGLKAKEHREIEET